MKILKTVTSAVLITSMVMGHSISFSANKATPKTQYTKKVYSKSPKKQSKEFKVPGVLAWSEAKKNGFKFFPQRHKEGNKSGTDDWGGSYTPKVNSRADTTPFDHRYHMPAHTVAGVNMLLYPCEDLFHQPLTCDANFEIFSGKTLKNGWKIKKLTFTGNYSWTSKKYKINTNNISTIVKVSNSKSRKVATKAQLKEVILIGPKNGRWQDAFDVM